MKEIKLTQGKVALVDDSTFEELSKFKWWAKKINDELYYAVRTEWIKGSGGKSRKIYMHRHILGVTQSNQLVDHIDRNGLNNQLANLRHCLNKSLNNANRRAIKNKTSIYLGVSLNNRGKWVAHTSKNNKVFHIGSFSDEIEAAKAYNKKAYEFHGEFANLNQV